MSESKAAANVKVVGPVKPEWGPILSAEALGFVGELDRRFRGRRAEILQARRARQEQLSRGERPDFLPATRAIRESAWTVGAVPDDLQDRRVEITGPVDRKMMINALNSGARVFMADFEDALSPTWPNIAQGQLNLWDAVRRTISFQAEDGRVYRLNDKIATLLVRPRGWHLSERHVLIDGQPISASLFDFGLYLFHNAGALRAKGSGPYYYLPKLESHHEARLWSDVFKASEERLGLAPGTIKVTVLIETVLAAFEMEEILYELREHIVGLNAGRWDYIFSVIKKFRDQPWHFPDRVQVTMTVPFMHAYTELLIRTCHKRAAHAIGGMAPYIPSRRDPAANERALAGVRADKEREAGAGCDGTWVAHPDLVPVATEVFDRHLGSRPHQKERMREEVKVKAADLLDFSVPNGTVTETGLRNNLSVATQYIGAWLDGRGAVGIFDLMEDAATAEISRSQLWQWVHRQARLADGRLVDRELCDRLLDEEFTKLGPGLPATYRQGVELLRQLTYGDFTEFFTLAAYDRLTGC